MGNDNNVPQKQPPQLSLEDQILELRMASKRFERESRKSEKESNKCKLKAKQALQKGNEEGARLFLQNAAMQQKQSIQNLRMAHKLETVQVQLKSSQQNQELLLQLNKVTPYLQQLSMDTPLEKICTQMNQFDEAMDGIIVNGNIMDQIVNKDNDVNQNMAVDTMLEQMKAEHNMQLQNELNANTQQQVIFNQLGTNQTINSNQQKIYNHQ